MSPPRRSAEVDDQRRRDPALGLLDRLVQEALDQGYVDAAANRPTPDQGRLSRHAVAAIGLALIGLVLAIALTQRLAGAPATAQRKERLATAISAATDRVDTLESELRGTTDEVTALQGSSLSSGAEGRALQAQLGALGPAAGTVAVSGPGVVVTVDDAPPDEVALGKGQPDLGRVLDRDLQSLVNGLWQSGAEAIDINGQRLTALSAIRGAGDAVLVNYRPLVRPYVVTAIGDPDSLAARFTSGAAGVELETLRQTYGVRYELENRDHVTIPGEPGVVLRSTKGDAR